MNNPPRPSSLRKPEGCVPATARTDPHSTRLERVRRLEQQVAGVFAGEVPVATDALADSSCWQGKDVPGNATGPISSGRKGSGVDSDWISSGCLPFDRCLPGASGFRRGSLVEWLISESGSGAGTLALLIARHACASNGTLVVIDPAGRFYPPAAAAIGIDLQRLLVVRPQSPRETLWAWDQSLRCSAVQAVWGWLEKIDDRWFRRLQLAVEQSDSLGLLLRPAKYRGAPSWSELQLLVSAATVRRDMEVNRGTEIDRGTDASSFQASANAASRGQRIIRPMGRWLRVEVVRCRGAVHSIPARKTGPAAIFLRLEERHGQLQVIEASGHETPALHLVSELANSTILGRSTGTC